MEENMHYTQVYHSILPSDDLIRQIKRMPKVELHVHLEGATSPELIFKMAARNKIALPVPTIEEWKTFYEFQDFNHFIDIYLLTVACMQTPQDFMEMAVDFMERQASQAIQYSEVFISAALHIQRIAGDEILAGLEEGIRIGRQKYGVEVVLIPDISRQTCVQKNFQEDVLRFALEAKERGIGIGLGIGGMEIGYPSELFRDVFDEARRQGLHVVAHAGETGDPGVIRDVIEVLRPERIGHGVRALEDPALVELLRQRQIPLEVSPQSNYCTRVFKPGDPHPIRQMVDAGLYCTLNSDDPSMFSTSLNNEYLTLVAQGFTWDELWQINLNGLKASFLGQNQKNEMKRKWETQ
jgi:adenosine deaminase